MRLCTSIPPITATTLCCSVPDPTTATGGDTMIGVAYFPAKSAATIQEGWRLQLARRPAGADRLHPWDCLFLWGAYEARAGQQALHYYAQRLNLILA
jgi:hypothetical protein